MKKQARDTAAYFAAAIQRDKGSITCFRIRVLKLLLKGFVGGKSFKTSYVHNL
jgi:hypothetical protein